MAFKDCICGSVRGVSADNVRDIIPLLSADVCRVGFGVDTRMDCENTKFALNDAL
jgi:hypothetical protein